MSSLIFFEKSVDNIDIMLYNIYIVRKQKLKNVIKKGELLLDPFCGTGGSLMEGGLIGARVVGTDVDWNMKNGAAINCEYLGIKDYKTAIRLISSGAERIGTSSGDLIIEEYKRIYDKQLMDGPTGFMK